MEKIFKSNQFVFIEAVRFPLMILVLLQHSVGWDPSPMRWSLEGTNAYHFITELISHHICSIAVPCFFFFSGFLFFHNIPDNIGDIIWVKDKWKRRSRTLLIPYLFWNLLNVAAILLVTAFFHGLSIPATSNQMPAVEKGPLFWFLTGPINFPLWYLRDLIVLSLLAPVLYYPFKKVPRLSLLLLLLVYLASAQWNCYPSFAFFGIGCWMALRRGNLLYFCHSIKYPAFVLSFLFLVLATAFYSLKGHQYLWIIFIPFGMISFMNLSEVWMKNPRIAQLMLKLSETVFFIYAAHEIYLMGWVKGLLLRIYGNGLAGQWISYFMTPLLTLLGCLFLFYLLKKLIPKSLAFLCGGRINPPQTRYSL